MYNSYIVTRTQIYLEETQHRRLRQLAESTGRTQSDLIRQAIDTFLDPVSGQGAELGRLRAVVGELRRAPLVSFRDGAAYVEELRRADAERLQELDRRRT
jgi:hypothetical protein